MDFHEALQTGYYLVRSEGTDLSNWSSYSKEQLQLVRDALQPERDFVCEFGTWSVIRMEYYQSRFVDEYR